MKLVRMLKDDRGNVESALVIVPLTILFLVGMQVAIAVHQRNTTKMHVQSGASIRALSGDFEAGDSFVHIESSGGGQNLDLLVAKRRSNLGDLLPTFLDGVSSGRSIDVDGIAIVENQR